MKKVKVSIEWTYLCRIAEYYEFPSAVFLGNMKVFDDKPKTRITALLKKVRAFGEIADIVNRIEG